MIKNAIAIRPVKFNSLGRDYVSVGTVNMGTLALSQRLGVNFSHIVDDYDESLQAGLVVDGYPILLLIRFLEDDNKSETRIYVPRELQDPRIVENLVASLLEAIPTEPGIVCPVWNKARRLALA